MYATGRRYPSGCTAMLKMKLKPLIFVDNYLYFAEEEQRKKEEEERRRLEEVRNKKEKERNRKRQLEEGQFEIFST